MVRCSFLLGLLAAPSLAIAATPVAKSPPPAAKPGAAAPAAKAPLPLIQGARRVALSPEGRTIAQKLLSTPDPRTPQLQKDVAAARQELVRLAAMPVVDVDRFEQALRRDEALAGEILKLKNDRMIALLRALPAADRTAFLQTLVNPPRPQNAPTTPAP